MDTRKANIYADSSTQLLETFSNAPRSHNKWLLAYAADFAAVILASSNGAIPEDVVAFETGSDCARVLHLRFQAVIGRTISHHRIVEELGSGGMGITAALA